MHSSPDIRSGDRLRPSAWRRRLGAVVVMALSVAGGGVLAAPSASAMVSTGTAFTTDAGDVTAAYTADGSGAPTVSGSSTDTPASPDTTTITLNAPRTLLTMSSLNLSAEDTLDFVFGSPGDIVLIQVDVGTATVSGAVHTFVGTSGSTVGGNVWIADTNGVTFGGTSRVDVGGLLATTGQITGTDFFDSDSAFTFTDAGAPVDMNAGAGLTGHGGVIAFVAGTVVQAVGAAVSAPTPGLEVLYGAAESGTVVFGTEASGALDLLGFVVPSTGASTSPSPLQLNGTTTAGDVLVASFPAPGGSTVVQGTLSATGAPASGLGQVRITSSGDLALAPGSTVAGSKVALSTGGNLTNAGSVSGPWVIYAATPDDIANAGLNSGNPAFWGADIDSAPPETFSGNRYVFAEERTLTFTALDDEKEFDETVSSFAYEHDGDDVFHPGVAGRFEPDTASVVFSGAPALRSDGAAANSRRLRSGPYDIEITAGNLLALNGYAFDFVDGALTVVDRTAPVVTPTVTGTLSASGWYTSDVGLDWSVVEDESYTDDTGCEHSDVTTDQIVSFTCDSVSPGGSTSVTQLIQRDTTGPTLQDLPDRTAYTMGSSAVATWPEPTANDALSGVAGVTCDRPSGSTFPRGTRTVTCTATDNAGNRGAPESFTVTVKRVVVTFASPIDAPAGMNTAVLGRVIPTRVTLTVEGSRVTRTSPVPLYLGAPTAMSCSVARSHDAVETYTTNRSNTGNRFRWDSATSRWLYNLDTGVFGLRANSCYRVPLNYGGSVAGETASGGNLAGFFYLQPKR